MVGRKQGKGTQQECRQNRASRLHLLHVSPTSHLPLPPNKATVSWTHHRCHPSINQSFLNLIISENAPEDPFRDVLYKSPRRFSIIPSVHIRGTWSGYPMGTELQVISTFFFFLQFVNTLVMLEGSLDGKTNVVFGLSSASDVVVLCGPWQLTSRAPWCAYGGHRTMILSCHICVLGSKLQSSDSAVSSFIGWITKRPTVSISDVMLIHHIRWSCNPILSLDA